MTSDRCPLCPPILIQHHNPPTSGIGTASAGHSRRYCHVLSVRNPQHRTLPRPTETRLLAAFLNGAPRPMKMGTTASPWRYDGLSDLGMSLAGVAVARRQRCNQSAQVLLDGASKKPV